MLLYLATKGREDLGELIFQIADQINHGIPTLVQPDMQIDIAELNFNAGLRAIDSSHFEVAQSYLNNALSLLPENHWSIHYQFSLRLFFLKAKAAYLCGDIEKSQELLKNLLDMGRCLEDILDAYHLYLTVRDFMIICQGKGH